MVCILPTHPCALPKGVPQGQTESWGRVLAGICWAPPRAPRGGVTQKRRCTYRPSVIYCQKPSLSFSLSLSLLRRVYMLEDSAFLPSRQHHLPVPLQPLACTFKRTLMLLHSSQHHLPVPPAAPRLHFEALFHFVEPQPAPLPLSLKGPPVVCILTHTHPQTRLYAGRLRFPS